ncbi:MAG: hypothetical protein ACRCZE_04300 [Candidatus Altimarinota bacterium]
MNTLKKHDPNAETLYGADEAPISLAPQQELEKQRNSGPRPVPLEQIVSNHPIEEATTSTRFKLFALGASMISFGAAGSAGYFLINGNPFQQKAAEAFVVEAPKVVPMPKEESPNVPDAISNEADFIKIMETYNIKITAEQLLEKSGNYYLEAQHLKPNIDENGEIVKPLSYKWETMVSHKNKVKQFNHLPEEDIVIATLNKTPQFGNVVFHGVRPTAVTKDKENPQISYIYYKCVEPKTNNLASFSLQKDPRTNMVMYSLRLTQCKPKTDLDAAPQP